MNNLITVEIKPRNFELVRNRIGLILYNEFEFQDYVSTDPFFQRPQIKVEKSVAFDSTEIPLINVSLSHGIYDNKDVQKTDGTYTYNIDCYTKGKEQVIEGEKISGDTLSAIRLERMLGIVQAIFDNPVYMTLNFARPSVSRVTVENINVRDTEKENQDALSTAMGRVQLSVLVPEANDLITPSALESYQTNVRLGLTQQGYIFNDNLGYM